MEKLPILKDLHIRITSQCNMNCPHCYAADWFKDETKLTFDEVKSVISQAIELGCQKVTFTGGEPLVYPFIDQSIEFCLDNNLRVELETNGLTVNKLIEKLDEQISKVEFAISYDGTEMRGKNTAPKVRENIKKLVELGCNVKIQTVVTKLNLKDLDHIFEFSKSLGIKNRVFLAHSPNGNGKNLSSLETQEWLNIVKELRSKYPHAIIELPDVFSGGSQKKCGWGVHRCEIMPNGDVTSCGPITFNKRGFKAGNIKEQPLKEIWSSEHFKYIRGIKQSDFKGLCSKCNFWEACLGACRSISSSTGGNLLSPHPFCSSVYNLILSGKADRNLIPNSDNVFAWAEHIKNSDSSPYKELYESIVRRQHNLV